MKYAFLTTLIPTELSEEIKNNSSYNMQEAANALEWNLYEGLCENYKQEIRFFNILPIGSFPQYYKKAFIKEQSFSTKNNNRNVNIGFCNIKLIRKYHTPKQIYKCLNKWCQETKEEKTLFVYTISAPFIKAVNKIKNKHKNLTVCAIVADLPDMSSLSKKKSFLHKIFEKRLAKTAYSNITCVDYFVLLTKYMADYIKTDKPYCVVEGIATSFNMFKQTIDKNLETKKIVYAGTLHEKFGVLNLVNAFMDIKDPNYELIICGIGDSENEIRKKSQQDGRIKFLGQLPREEVLSLQSNATVLVNPRQNNEEFTKYSFPSKNLEYLSSGIPFVAYKLDGIPDEYDDYINYVKGDEKQALTEMLVRVCEDVDGKAKSKANNARAFVERYKNPVVQTLKIKEMLESEE